MKFIIKHEIPGRIRIHMVQKQMSCKEADALLYYLNTLEYVSQAKVYRRTADACVCFVGKREPLILALRKFQYTSLEDVYKRQVLVLLMDTEQKRNCCRQEPEKLQKQWKRLRRF